MRPLLFVAMLIATAVPAQAQTKPDDAPVIVVTGVGKVRTTPDVAELEVTLRGEGKTSDEATRMLAKRQDAVLGGIAAIDPAMGFETDNISVVTLRDLACKADGEALSTGDCAVVGYVAVAALTVRLSSTKDAGTAIGVAGKLGAGNARLESFALKSPAAAYREALGVALDNARVQAAAIAAGSGARLGPIVKVMDEQSQGSGDIVITAGRVNIGRPDAIVPVIVSPGPIETEAKLTVTFALLK